MAEYENHRPHVLIKTLGCKVNQYDSEKIRTRLLQQGYHSVSEKDGIAPEIVIVNTCTVTSASSRKARQLIRRMIRKYPQAHVMVTGCYSDLKPEEIREIPGVAELVAIKDQERWTRRQAGNLESESEDRDARRQAGEGIDIFGEHTRAFVKVQDGCDLKCTFCIIPAIRGPARSRPIAEIVTECKILVERDYPEIVLCGVCLGNYGLESGCGLPELIGEIVRIDGLKRVRISSLEPQNVTDALFEIMAEHSDIVCPHLHLPLQSGSNKILRRMKRPYTVEFFLERIARARNMLPSFEISTDIMVGFPGETEEDFEETLAAVRQGWFSKVHSFRFSVRENTPAARMKDRLSPHVIEDRRRRLDEIAIAIANDVKRSYIGKTLPVLIEKMENHRCTGLSPNYLRVDFRTSKRVARGEVILVRCSAVKKGRLQGEAV